MRPLEAKSPVLGHVTVSLIVIAFTCVIGATYGFGLYLFPVLISEMARDLGFNFTIAGLLTALAQVGFLVAAVISGVMAPRIGAARVIVGSVFVCAAGLFALFAVGSVFVMAFAFITLGACTASAWTPMVGVIGQIVPQNHRAKVLGLIASGTNYGIFLNGILVPHFLSNFTWREVWFAAGSLTLLIAFASLVLLFVSGHLKEVPDRRSCSAEEASDPTVTLSDIFRARPFVVWLVMFLSGCSCVPFLNYFSAFLQTDLGLEIGAVGQAWMLVGVLGMIGGVSVGVLGDRIGINATLALMYCLVLAATILLIVGGYVVHAYLAAVFLGISFNGIFGLIPAYVSKKFDDKLRVGIFAGCNIFLALGSMTGNFLAGWGRSVFESFYPVYIVIGIILTILLLLCKFFDNTIQRATAVHDQ